MFTSEVTIPVKSKLNYGGDSFLVSDVRIAGESRSPTTEPFATSAVLSYSQAEEIGALRRENRSWAKRMILADLRNSLFLACSVFCSLPAQTDSLAIRLGQTEREFSRAAGLNGIRSAFLEYFDDACVIFAPRPTNGKLAYSADSDSHGSLVWMPTVVEVSASGDFGYTTGPSEYREENSPSDSAHYGHFVSVWKRNYDGRWKVILDFGNGYPKREKREEQLRVRQLHSNGGKREIQSVVARSSWLTADSAYSATAMNEGSNGALEKFGSEDVRLYRRGKFPAQGMDAAYRLVRGEKFSGFKFSAGQISSASDLGFTYGLAVTANADTNNYIRVWRRENEWKIVVDALNPWVRKN